MSAQQVLSGFLRAARSLFSDPAPPIPYYIRDKDFRYWSAHHKKWVSRPARATIYESEDVAWNEAESLDPDNDSDFWLSPIKIIL